MATSGSLALVSFSNVKLIEYAFRRCKVRPEAITAEMLTIAKDALQMMLDAMVNEGWQLWAQERRLLGMYEGNPYVEMPEGSLDVMNVSRAQPLRLSGVNTSSAGGTADLAFDGDLETACTQVSPNGNLQVEFASATYITILGLLPNATGTWSWVVENSNDGFTWNIVQTVTDQAVEAGQWLWYDVDGYTSKVFFRFRATGGTTLDIDELFLSNTVSEIPLGRINIDQYANYPNRSQRTTPTDFFYDRQINPRITLWGVPAYINRLQYLAIWRRRYLQNVGDFTQSVEVPREMYEAVEVNLAWRLCQLVPESDQSMLPALKATADQIWKMARIENRDRSRIYFNADTSPYTR